MLRHDLDGRHHNVGDNMDNILQKTVQSLEAALRYNPESVELKTSLAEAYVRMGQINQRTMDLCETVLNHQIENALLERAHHVGVLIEQTRQIEEDLTQEDKPPEDASLDEALQTIGAFLEEDSDCYEARLAQVRLALIKRQYRLASNSLSQLNNGQRTDSLNSIMHCLQWAMAHPPDDEETLEALVDCIDLLGPPGRFVEYLEQQFDAGHTSIGPVLLRWYQRRFNANQPEAVPSDKRNRLFFLLLDFADHETTDRWLRRVLISGWEISSFTKVYARNLLEHDEPKEAFEVLKRVRMDPEVKELLNRIAQTLENEEDYDTTAAVLRFINDHELVDEGQTGGQEEEIQREAERSIGEIHLRHGRLQEGFQKLVAALKLSPEPDLELLDRIDEVLETSSLTNHEPIFELADYFQHRGDYPKAAYYLNKILAISSGDRKAILKLEAIYDDILAQNPDLPDLRLELGRLYLQTDRCEEALEQLEQAARSDILNAQANRLMGRVLVRLERHPEALVKYRTGEPEEEDAPQLQHLAEALLQEDDPRGALVAFQMLARLCPDDPEVAANVQQLQSRISSISLEEPGDVRMRELIGDLATGRYRHVEQLGSGGMGVVHKVIELRNQRVVAMKILRDSLSSSTKALDRFFREARIAATLHHPNIVAIFDYNISNISGQSYIVMEYVDGPSLREIVDHQFDSTTTTELTYVTEVLYYAIQLADALQAAHDKGIIHRDIKPDNVMINTQGEVKITDFGIVHIEEATCTPTGAMLGTPRYMSPEQVTGGKIDMRSDIYSMGILIYEALVGSPPFLTGDVSYQQVHNVPVPPREINPVIPQTCNEIVMKCLEKSVEHRFANASALRQALMEQLDALGGCAKFGRHQATDIIGAIGSDDDLDL